MTNGGESPPAPNGGFSALTDNSLYLPQPGSTAAAHPFSGTLRVYAVRMSASGREPAGRYGFPQFSVLSVTLGDVLLPLEREIIRGDGSNEWSIILSPGRVWSEPDDRGMSRASFPFTLVTDEWNEAHNGVATFLYDDASATNLRLQRAQEAAPWNRLDSWAVTSTRYTPEVIPGDDHRMRNFEEARAQRVTTKPWPELAVDFPGIEMAESSL